MIKRSPEPKRRKEPEKQIGSMDDADIDEPPLPIPTGPEHWEEQRRKWTANDVSRTERQKRIHDDVHPTLREVTQHSRFWKIRNASYATLVEYYREIMSYGFNVFEGGLRLSGLFPILVAGWKDAGTPLPSICSI
jgi:hypothetical protein